MTVTWGSITAKSKAVSCSSSHAIITAQVLETLFIIDFQYYLYILILTVYNACKPFNPSQQVPCSSMTN